MIPQANIISLLPAKAPVEVAPPRESSAGDDSFRSHMEEAVKQSSDSQRERKTARAEEREKAGHEPQDHQPAEVDNRPAKEKETPSAVNQSSAQPAQPRQSEDIEPADNLPANTTVNRETITDQLQALGVSQNNIDALLKVLNLRGDANLNTFLQSLAQTLGQASSLKAQPLPQAANVSEQAAGLLQNSEQPAQELLTQSGLNQQQAKDLFAKLQSAQLQESASQLNRETQLKGKAKVEESLDQKISLEKILGQSSEGVSSANEKPPVLKTAAGIGKSLENPVNPNLTASSTAAALKGNDSPLKNGATLKDLPNVQVTQVSTSNNSSAKILDAQKSFASQTYNTRGADDAKVIHQILNKISLRSHGNQNEIKVRLEPPSLGTVRMNVTTSGDAVKTVIMTDNNTVKQIIESNLAQLRDSLNGNGLKVESFTVLVGGDQGSGSRQNTSHENAFGHASAYAAEDPLAQESELDVFTAARSRMFYDESTSISVMA